MLFHSLVFKEHSSCGWINSNYPVLPKCKMLLIKLAYFRATWYLKIFLHMQVAPISLLSFILHFELCTPYQADTGLRPLGFTPMGSNYPFLPLKDTEKNAKVPLAQRGIQKFLHLNCVNHSCLILLTHWWLGRDGGSWPSILVEVPARYNSLSSYNTCLLVIAFNCTTRLKVQQLTW